MTYDPTCAVCGHSVLPDTDHVQVEAERKRMDDRNETDDYYFHEDCWRGVAGSWRQP
jgi:hypothetical protein